ncbi:MAG: NUDIX domain-containing protein [Chloroflexota bacterium]|nr:NUDIX domain-containing protein [Chloroflexota bacterium]
MPARPLVGVGILVRKNGQVLLMKRKNSHGAGSWSPPGGHVEFGESLESCARRETQEEAGVYITDVTFRAVTNDFFEAEGKHYFTMWMEGRYISGEAIINAPSEAAEVGWFTWNMLPQPLFLPFANLLAGKCYPPDYKCENCT